MVNEYFYTLAKRSAEISGISAKWIYVQWVHETGNFTSELCTKYHNLGGLTQTEENDTPQPDGQYWYMQFDTYEAYAEYFGRYLKYYAEDGLYEAQTIQEYAEALKHGGYFGDSVEHYVAGMDNAYEKSFG